MKERIEYFLIRYIIFNETPKTITKPQLLFVIADISLKDRIDSIRDGVCPYCNTKFKKIYNHLINTSTHCSRSFVLDLLNTYNMYMKLLNNITKERGLYVLELKNSKHIFKNKEELLNIIKQNPDILKDLTETSTGEGSTMDMKSKINVKVM